MVDCTDLEFVDASRLRTFVIADNELREQGRRLSLVNAMSMLARVLGICGLTDLLIPTNTPDAVRAYEVV